MGEGMEMQQQRFKLIAVEQTPHMAHPKPLLQQVVIEVDCKHISLRIRKKSISMALSRR